MTVSEISAHRESGDPAVDHQRTGGWRDFARSVGRSWRWTLGCGLSFVLHHSGILPVYERLRRPVGPWRIAVLMYHRVTDDDQSCRFLCVSTKNFRKQMEFLAHSRYRVISIDALVRCLQGQETLHGDVALVTFDDGYRDILTNAVPILREFRIPATIFLPTGLIDSQETPWWDRIAQSVGRLRHAPALPRRPEARLPPRIWDQMQLALRAHPRSLEARIEELAVTFKTLDRDEREPVVQALEALAPPADADPLLLTWDMIRAMSGDLITFGAHTVTHPVLGRVAPELARWELSQSKSQLEARLGREVTCFAYPHGADGDYNATTVQLLRETGYQVAFTAQKGTNLTSVNPLLLRRCAVPDAPAHVLAARLHSLLCGRAGKPGRPPQPASPALPGLHPRVWP